MDTATTHILLALFAFLTAVTLLVSLNRRADRALSPHGMRWRKARRVRRRLRKDGMTAAQRMAYLRKIDPYVFEELVLLSFRDAGYAITRNRRYSGDGGLDGKIRKGGTRWFVQCKRYGGYICARHVDAFSALCERTGVRGVFVHTGKTGGASKDVVRQDKSINIISGDRLLRLVVDGEDVLNQ